MPYFGRFLWNGAPTFARIEGEGESQRAHFLSDLFESQTPTGESELVSALEILPPVLPSKLFAIGLNYADHAAEHGNKVPDQPLMWFKAPSSLLPHGGEIQIAFPDHRTDHEAELAIVIGKRGKAIAESQAHEFIFGYTPAQDISDRPVQRGESQWARAKSFDTYTPLGPFISTDFDPADALVECVVNGQIKQSARTSLMVFPPAKIVSFVSQHITLEPGDVILTGTPEGVGPLQNGDELETRIQGLPILKNRVRF